jgi:hypothetical protein
MMHGSGDFTAHVLDLLKHSGPTGPSGPSTGKTLIFNDKVGTSRRDEVGPVGNEWSQHARASGPGKGCEKQLLTGGGTTGTSGTSLFAGDDDQSERGGSPAEWHAILAGLEQRSWPDWLGPDRWEALLSDAENFLSRWGAAAHALGWTALDLFGVHPTVPASRFDLMGLLPLVQGGAVIAMTEDGATLRRETGAVLNYRRCTAPGAVLISQVRT